METSITPGTIVDGDLEVARLLASGGTASVYLANHLTMKKELALKVLHLERSEDESAIQRFKREAIAIAKLAHPNIVTIYRTGIWNSRPFIAMEFIEGESLADRLVRGPIPVDDAIPLFADICNALTHAHLQGVIHRDLKPGNIMLCDNGRIAKLTDFGIAKLAADAGNAQQKLTRTGELFGTLAYMSPEQLENKPADERSDIYSLACLMYETLSGQPPFSGESFELLHKHLNSGVQPISTIPEGLNKVLLASLSKDPRDRPQSAAALREAILNPSAFIASRNEKSSKTRFSKKLMLPLLLAAALALGIFAFLSKNPSTNSPAVESSITGPNSAKSRSDDASRLDSLHFKDLQARLDKEKGHSNRVLLLNKIADKLKHDKSARTNRDTKLYFLSKYAAELDRNHLPLSSSRIRKEIVQEVKLHGLPKQLSGGGGHFTEEILAETQLNLIKTLFALGLKDEPPAELALMAQLQPPNSIHLFEAALVLHNEALIKRGLESIGSNDAGKAAHLLLAANRIDQLKAFLLKHIGSAQTSQENEYSYSDAFLFLTKAEMLLTEGKTVEARKIVKDLKLDTAKYDSEEKREKRLSLGVTILSLLGEFKEAEKLIRSLNLPDAPQIVHAETMSERDLQTHVDSINNHGNDLETRKFIDGMMETKLSPYMRTNLLHLRGRKSINDCVSAYYLARAYEESKNIPEIRGLQLLCHYDYARVAEESECLGLALKEYDAILANVKEKGLDKPYFPEDQLLGTQARVVKVCVALDDRERIREMGIPKQKQFGPDVPLHLFVLGRNLLLDDQGALDLIKKCSSIFELAYCAETCLSHGRIPLVLMCRDRLMKIVDKEKDSESRIIFFKYLTVLSAFGSIESEKFPEARRFLQLVLPLGSAADYAELRERFELGAALSGLKANGN